MGMGYSLLCDCGETDILLGIGMMFVDASEGELKAARKGEFGKEAQKRTVGKQNVFMDPNQELFYCKKCGYWKIDSSHNVYEQGNLVYKHKHTCPNCEEELIIPKKISRHIVSKLRCQNCGGKMSLTNNIIMWD